MAQLGLWFLHLQRVCLLRQRLLCALELVRVRVKVRARVRVRVRCRGGRWQRVRQR